MKALNLRRHRWMWWVLSDYNCFNEQIDRTLPLLTDRFHLTWESPVNAPSDALFIFLWCKFDSFFGDSNILFSGSAFWKCMIYDKVYTVFWIINSSGSIIYHFVWIHQLMLIIRFVLEWFVLFWIDFHKFQILFYFYNLTVEKWHFLFEMQKLN